MLKRVHRDCGWMVPIGNRWNAKERVIHLIKRPCFCVNFGFTVVWVMT